MKFIFLSILIVLSLGSVQKASGCMSASQNRLFYLGKIMDSLVFIHTELRRGEVSASDRIEWNGDVWRIYVSSKNGKIVKKKYRKNFRTEDNSYKVNLANLLMSELRLVKQPNFIQANQVDTFFTGNYSDSNMYCHLQFNVDKNSITMHLLNKDLPCTSLLDSNTVANNIYLYLQEAMSNDVKDIVKHLQQSLGINSVRIYNLGSQHLALVHLGLTHPNYDESGKEILNSTNVDLKKNIPFAASFLFDEEVEHHGNSADLFFLF